MPFTPPQRRVVAGMGVGLAVSLAVLGWAPAALGHWRAEALRVLAFATPAACLAVCIARLAAHRFFTPADIDGSALVEGTPQARLLQALLQNTLEQCALAFGTYAAWLAAPTAHGAPAEGYCAAAAILFAVGRILFFAGYRHGAGARALGFALTFYPTVILLVARLLGLAGIF